MCFPREGFSTAANLSLIWATPGQLRKWGYTTASVPSAEDRINACVALVCEQQVECWAGVDQYLTQQVVPEVPYLVQTNTTIVSSRVRADSFDQSGSLPALDRFALGS